MISPGLVAPDSTGAVSWLLHHADWALFVAVLGVGVPIVLYRLGRQRKHVTFKPDRTPLVTVERGHGIPIEIRYDGVPVLDLSLVTVVIRNDGDLAIDEPDFREPIRITFGKFARVLTWDVARAWEPPFRPEIGPRLVDGMSGIEVKRELLNQGDGMVMTFLVERAGPVSVTARIVGVPAIELDTYDPGAPTMPRWVRRVFFAFFGASAIAMAFIAGVLWPSMGEGALRDAIKAESIIAVVCLLLWFDGDPRPTRLLRKLFLRRRSKSAPPADQQRV